jgi:carboxymethylenebutenolidase
VNQYERYLANEIAFDHADGMMTRREAMRRLGLLGLSAVGASALLAACGGDDDEEAGTASTAAGGQTQTTASSPPPTASGAAPVATQNITYPGRGITLQGAFAAAASPRGAVLVIHENRGLTDHIRSVAGRLAADRYNALAVDLLSAQGGTASFTDQAALGPALTENASTRAVDDMKSSLEELGRRTPNAKLGAIGFCFGGGMVWQLLKAGEPPPLHAAAPFYGPINDPDFSRSKAAVLGVYAENDNNVNPTRDGAKAALERARLTHEIRTFPGTGHAFFNDTGQRYNAEQASAAYRAVLDWFGRYLG